MHRSTVGAVLRIATTVVHQNTTMRGSASSTSSCTTCAMAGRATAEQRRAVSHTDVDVGSWMEDDEEEEDVDDTVTGVGDGVVVAVPESRDDGFKAIALLKEVVVVAVVVVLVVLVVVVEGELEAHRATPARIMMEAPMKETERICHDG